MMSTYRLRRNPQQVNPGAWGALLRRLLGGVVSFRRENPRRLLRPAQRQSQTFHGRPHFTKRIAGREHVVLGTLEAVEYRAPDGSQRAGLWRHAAGDRGKGKVPVKGRADVVADPKTGALEIDGGPMKFQPEKGMVG